MFSEQGYGARLSDIADRAGMKTGSLYYHFDFREDLVAEILHRGIETSFDHVRQASMCAADGRPDRPAGRRRSGPTPCRSWRSAPTRRRGPASWARSPGLVAKAHQRDQRAYGTYWNDLFEAAQAHGDIAVDVDLFVVRMLAFGAMNWIAEWSPLAGKRSADRSRTRAVAAAPRAVLSARPRLESSNLN